MKPNVEEWIDELKQEYEIHKLYSVQRKFLKNNLHKLCNGKNTYHNADAKGGKA